MKRILICGADGFIGAALADALQATGHQVSRGVHRVADKDGELHLDYRQLRAPPQWLAVLPDVDVVINCVGIIRETPLVSFAPLHEEAPKALFQACAQRGVRRVLQLSALGADVNGSTAYFRSKGRADAALQMTELDWTVVRPSLVIGGYSTLLFRRLASLPVLVLPAGA